MKTFSLSFTLLLVTAAGYSTPAQHGASTQSTTFSQTEDHYASDAEHALVSLAAAMPENKYSFAPTNGEFKGVRTFADMVKHAAASNYGMAAAILHQKSPVKLETEADLDVYTTKADIVRFLQGSFDFLHKALSSINQGNETDLIQSPDTDKPIARQEVADRAISHCWNHYGQLVEYLRMNGIVPPASHR